MRDIVSQDPKGSYTKTFSSTRKSTGVTTTTVTTTSVTTGFIRKGRSLVTKSDGMRATPYRAYDIHIRHESFRQFKVNRDSRYYYNTTLYEGGYTIPPPTYCLAFISEASGFTPSLPLSLVADAQNLALAKARNAQFEAGTFIGELRESASLIISLLANGLRLAYFIRKGKWGKAYALVTGKNSIPKAAANAYAATNWGIKPLVNDIRSLLKLMAEGIRRDEFAKIQCAVVENQQHPHYSSRFSASGSWEIGCEIGCSYTVRNPELLAASMLGLTNPFHTAWNLLPLSFVVDWFISVGSFLQGLGATIGLDFVGGYRTEFVKSKNLRFYDSAVPISGYEGEPSVSRGDAFAFRRVPLYDWPSPSISFNLDLDFTQLVSAVALTTQRA